MALFDSGKFYDNGTLYDELITTIRTPMKTNVVLGLFELNPAETAQLTQNIITAITGNPNFGTPSPSLVSLQAKLTTLTGKINGLAVAEDARTLAVNERDDALEDIRDALNDLAAYVQNVSGGDPTMIVSAGMGVRASRNPAVMTQVEDLRLEASEESGVVTARWRAIRRKLIYNVQTCTDVNMPLTNWVNKLETGKAHCVLNHDLVSGQKVWVRVRAVGPNNAGPWSDPAWKTVP